jgi:hypothetical protein
MATSLSIETPQTPLLTSSNTMQASPSARVLMESGASTNELIGASSSKNDEE